MSEDKRGQEEISQFSWRRLLTTTVIVIVTAGVVFGITWFILDKMVREDQEVSDKLRVKLQEEIDELRKELKNGTSDTSENSKLYKNVEYGFQFTMPDSWQGYKVKSAEIEGATTTIYFTVPTTDSAYSEARDDSDAGFSSIFAVSVYNDEQWEMNQSQEGVGSRSVYLGKSGQYTFGYSHAQSAASDTTKANDDFRSIIDSFKLI